MRIKSVSNGLILGDSLKKWLQNTVNHKIYLTLFTCLKPCPHSNLVNGCMFLKQQIINQSQRSKLGFYVPSVWFITGQVPRMELNPDITEDLNQHVDAEETQVMK